jgi:hypothetical protein
MCFVGGKSNFSVTFEKIAIMFLAKPALHSYHHNCIFTVCGTDRKQTLNLRPFLIVYRSSLDSKPSPEKPRLAAYPSQTARVSARLSPGGGSGADVASPPGNARAPDARGSPLLSAAAAMDNGSYNGLIQWTNGLIQWTNTMD